MIPMLYNTGFCIHGTNFYGAKCFKEFKTLFILLRDLSPDLKLYEQTLTDFVCHKIYSDQF